MCFAAVMVTHCALSAQHIQKFAKNDPFVYVGDFNIKPDSSMYALLTEGTIDKKVLYTSAYVLLRNLLVAECKLLRYMPALQFILNCLCCFSFS